MLLDVVMAMRMLPTRPTGRSAFELAYKQVPNPPLPFEFSALDGTEAPFVLEEVQGDE